MAEGNQSAVTGGVSLTGLFWLACVIVFSLQESWCKSPSKLESTTDLFQGSWGLSITWCTIQFLDAAICLIVGLAALCLGSNRLRGLAGVVMAPIVAACSVAQLYYLIEAHTVHNRGLDLENLDEFCFSWHKSFNASMVNLTAGVLVSAIGLAVSLGAVMENN